MVMAVGKRNGPCRQQIYIIRWALDTTADVRRLAQQGQSGGLGGLRRYDIPTGRTGCRNLA